MTLGKRKESGVRINPDSQLEAHCLSQIFLIGDILPKGSGGGLKPGPHKIYGVLREQ